jgi:hypothetical protein
MDKIIFKEAVITSVTKNTFKEIVVKMKLSPDDYSPELEEELYSLRQNSESIVVLIQPSGYIPPPDTRNAQLSKLHRCMERYSNITGTDMEKLLQDLYARYGGIDSRTKLTDQQLETEIQFFTSI